VQDVLLCLNRKAHTHRSQERQSGCTTVVSLVDVGCTDTTNAELPGIREHLDAAMAIKKDVFVSYNGGTNGDRPRKITPLHWLSEKEGKMEVICHLFQPQKKTFSAHKDRLRVEDHDWELPLLSSRQGKFTLTTWMMCNGFNNHRVTDPSNDCKSKRTTTPDSVEKWLRDSDSNNIGTFLTRAVMTCLRQWWDLMNQHSI
jgi:hypothetical protein